MHLLQTFLSHVQPVPVNEDGLVIVRVEPHVHLQFPPAPPVFIRRGPETNIARDLFLAPVPHRLIPPPCQVGGGVASVAPSLAL
jgi:hypothetical protein